MVGIAEHCAAAQLEIEDMQHERDESDTRQEACAQE